MHQKNNYFRQLHATLLLIFLATSQLRAGFTDFRITTDTLDDHSFLLELYDSLGGENWDEAVRWDTVGSYTDFHGICLDDDGNVTGIKIDQSFTGSCNPSETNSCVSSLNINAVGTLPQEIDLSSLKIFSVAFQEGIVGEIPNFSLATNLEKIDIHCNSLIGSLDPEKFANLFNLRNLNIQGNDLGGNIPDFLDLFGLEILRMPECNLTGSIPEFNDSPNLIGIYLQGNQLNGEVPAINFSSPFFASLIINSNNFTFEDLLPNYDYLIENTTNYEYVPQHKIYKDTCFLIAKGGDLTIDLEIDEDIPTNTYNWYKNGEFSQSIIGDNNLVFSDIALWESGIYTCSISNSIITDLILESYSIEIKVCEPTSYEINPLLCPGDVFVFHDTIYDEENLYGEHVLSYAGAEGCDSIVKIDIEYFPIAIAMDDTLICDPVVELIAVPLPPDSEANGHWESVSGTPLPDPDNTTNLLSDLSPGEHLFKWVLESEACQRYDSVTVSIFYEATPQAFNEKITLFSGDDHRGNFLSKSQYNIDADRIAVLEWPRVDGFEHFGDGDYSFGPPGWFTGKDSVLYEICPPTCPEVYCSGATITLEVRPLNTRPNVITPGDDLYNEYFVIDELTANFDKFPSNKLTIVNEYGSIVFQVSNYKNDWNGVSRNNKPLPESIYYYHFDYGNGNQITGELLIIRK